MRRRHFLTLFGSAVTWPLASYAQQPERMRRVGVLMHTTAEYQTDKPVWQHSFRACRRPVGPLGETYASIPAGPPLKPIAFVITPPNWLGSRRTWCSLLQARASWLSKEQLPPFRLSLRRL